MAGLAHQTTKHRHWAPQPRSSWVLRRAASEIPAAEEYDLYDLMKPHCDRWGLPLRWLRIPRSRPWRGSADELKAILAEAADRAEAQGD